MRVRIDPAGRVVIPKKLRDDLGLVAGSELDLDEKEGTLTLRPVDENSGLVSRNGHWVFCGQLPPGFDLVKFIEGEREEGTRQQGGR